MSFLSSSLSSSSLSLLNNSPIRTRPVQLTCLPISYAHILYTAILTNPILMHKVEEMPLFIEDTTFQELVCLFHDTTMAQNYCFLSTPLDLPAEATEQAIHLRTMLLILARSVEWGNACHYPLKGHWQGKKMIRWRGWVYLAWGTRRTGLQGKDQENLTGVLWQQLWPLYTTTVFVHVYTRSPIKDKSDYLLWSHSLGLHLKWTWFTPSGGWPKAIDLLFGLFH